MRSICKIAILVGMVALAGCGLSTPLPHDLEATASERGSYVAELRTGEFSADYFDDFDDDYLFDLAYRVCDAIEAGATKASIIGDIMWGKDLQDPEAVAKAMAVEPAVRYICGDQ